MRELLAARWWGCPSPGHYDRLDKDERLDILAAYELDWRINAVSAWEDQVRANRSARRKARRK